MSSHPIKRKSNSSSNKRLSCIEGVGYNFSLGNSSMLKLIFKLIGTAKRPPVGVAAAVDDDVPAFIELAMLAIAFVVNLLVAADASCVCGGVDVAPPVLAAILAGINVVFGVIVLMTEVPEAKHDKELSNDEDCERLVILSILYV